MHPSKSGVLCAVVYLVVGATLAWSSASRVKTDSGTVEGVSGSGDSVRIYKGIPFAAPPVGDLRWKEPRRPAAWKDVRKADAFGARCAQGNMFSDMVFRDAGMSEDCLYLNIWAPAKGARMPVLVYFHGGGFAAGSGDEPRYDGENFARKGIVVVTVNYRLGVFGFLAHAELTAESPHKASGNYGMLDQVAALEWVERNIAAFGGDPKKVTIGGESAGSFAVSALMASPLSRQLIAGAIGESGAMFSTGSGTLAAQPLAKAEQSGTEYLTAAGVKSIAELRSKSADELLKVPTRGPGLRFAPIIDGYFLPDTPASIYAKGQQSHVPLLAGWNADEVRIGVLAANPKPNGQILTARLKTAFPDALDAAQKVYAAANDEEALRAAGDLASDQFIDYCTWKWIEEQSKTGKSPVYRYEFDRPVPLPAGTPDRGVKGLAGHSWELEYVFGALDSKKAAWEPEDRKTSETMANYFANFIKTGDPNSSGLAPWPPFSKGNVVMHLDASSGASAEEHRDRYVFLDEYYQKHQ
ncbi:MAG TPA: carboxylesterase family protein [Bryobacteraceae bacterium]|nr:carboxylesterase family protein [Bryobacteraceae bacterium]